MTATRSLSASVQCVGRTLLAADSACPDAELIRRFVERRDEGAFAALVHRHAGVVYGVCRRVLRHEQDAEDAFQATFVVLARNAASLRKAGAVGNWLYGVAYNVARKARATRQRRQSKEREAAAQQRLETLPVVVDDWQEVLDKELHGLPEKYRAAILLCDLMGQTTEAAAREVGCPPKTLGTRLSRGRVLLAQRLRRRNVTLPAGALTLAATRCAMGAGQARLVGSAVEAALGVASGSVAMLSPTVVALTEGVANVMTWKTSKCVMLVACGVLILGGLAHYPTTPAPTETSPVGVRMAAVPAPPKTVQSASILAHLHQFFVYLHTLVGWTPERFKARDDKKEAGLTGTWVRKEGELKIEFTGKDSLKIFPHGENEVIVVLCEYSLGKDGLVKAKLTSLEGKEDAIKKAKELLPIGLKFSFQWKVKGGVATVGEVKGDKVETLKSHLEGDYAEKK